ncbi:MAG TPA: hypothetical protein ENJ46_01535, partial [Hellea balneolensis]|nr:hypothetical protein [Hellea balneolensis]
MSNLLKYVVTGLVILSAVLLGAFTAKRSLTMGAPDSAFIHNGAWRTSLYIGSKDASPHIRAYVAVIGLLGLSREETIYFQAYSDDEGNPISSDNVYEIIGGDLPARWWSL